MRRFRSNARPRRRGTTLIEMAVVLPVLEAEGVTIHTLAVGIDADRDLMRAIAFAGGGQFIDCPGGSTIAEMQAQLNAAFSKIAANVPPPKLLNDPDAP